MEKYVYAFGGGVTEGGAEMKMLLGNKGANLAEMSSLGLPVPPGFTITTEASDHYFKNGGEYPEGMWEEVDKNLARVEGEMEAECEDQQLGPQRQAVKRKLFGSNIGVNGSSQSL